MMWPLFIIAWDAGSKSPCMTCCAVLTTPGWLHQSAPSHAHALLSCTAAAHCCCALLLRTAAAHCCCALLLRTAAAHCCAVLQRTALSDEDIRSEVEALERQGHRRLLVLTGEHPKYTFDQFLHVSSPQGQASSVHLQATLCSSTHALQPPSTEHAPSMLPACSPALALCKKSLRRAAAVLWHAS
jgi:hypothetical protein